MSQIKHHLIVFYGGKSSEHEVSCRSVQYVFSHLDLTEFELHVVAIDKAGIWRIQQNEQILKNKSEQFASVDTNRQAIATDLNILFDVLGIDSSTNKVTCFNMIHGGQGEDGKLQGIFEYHDVAYTGPDLLSTAICMDKVMTKQLCESIDVAVVPYVYFHRLNWKDQKLDCLKQIEETISYPVFVKPSCSGSAVGVSKAKNQKELIEAVELAYQYDKHVLVEQAMAGREIEFSFLGNQNSSVVVGPAEILSDGDFYTYDQKYSQASTTEVIMNASGFSDEWRNQAYDKVKKIAAVLRVDGISRFDFFLVKDKLYLNEVNTIPGFTSISVYPKLLEESGISAQELIHQIIELAQTRHQIR